MDVVAIAVSPKPSCDVGLVDRYTQPGCFGGEDEQGKGVVHKCCF